MPRTSRGRATTIPYRVRRRRRPQVAPTLLILAALAALLVWWSSTATPELPTLPPGAQPATALEGLSLLEVRDHDPSDDYDRTLFAYRQVDLDGNGCDVRNDVLRRDLTSVVISPDSQGCVVMSGILEDPYTGALIEFQRGENSSGDVQIDHVVAMSNAWRTGAQEWETDRLHAFGNDPLNLLAVDGPANQDKSDADASGWLPTPAFQCEFVARQTTVKLVYELWVTPQEQRAMAEVLHECPTEPLTSSSIAATP